MGSIVNTNTPSVGRASSVLWNWLSAREARSSLVLFSLWPEASSCWEILFCLMFTRQV